MSQQLISNPTSQAREVVIRTPDGKKDSIFLQPNSKAKIPHGATIDASFHSRNPQIRKTVLK